MGQGIGTSIFYQIRRLFQTPERLLAVFFLSLLSLLVITPLVEIVWDALSYQEYDLAYRPEAEVGGFTLFHLERVFTGRLSRALFYKPLINSLMIGAGVTVLAVTIGSGLAWLMVRTDLPFRGFFGAMAVVPYMMPSWVLALAWMTMFKNDRIGGSDGLFTYYFGVQPPDWIAYGLFPIIITLALHYYAYAYLLVSGALMTVDSELEEAGAICGLSRFQRLWRITVPLLLPAIGSAVVLTFIRILGTFGTPALLGLPVRFFTFSTQIYASLNAGSAGDGYVLAVVLVIMAIVFIYINSRILGVRRSFVTVTGKGFRQRRIPLGRWRMPLAFLIGLFIVTTVFAPLILLAWESLLINPGEYGWSNLTLHFWIGESGEDFVDGDAGVMRNDQILAALWNSLRLGFFAAGINGVIGLLIGYAIVRTRGTVMSKSLESIAFAPYIFPSIALGAIYLGIFSTGYGPMPALYGTFALLVLITTVKNLPFTSRTGISALLQIDKSLEEAARVQGISWGKRMFRIIIPMSTSGLVAGMMLTFITAMRELSLIILLLTPSTMVMTGLIFGYESEDKVQHAGAVTLILVLIIIGVNLLVRRFFGDSLTGLRQS
ncbi:ABC transporter, permease protein 1 (cluster 1, maltose/g3p/polyamine/iron) / ABC transporter, permease protein 2 (cluster 1, maltose/g3p/polyamine/iron) [hydrothermal vent metagenome]|uniref:ABC transporter, permease protein 1 (Cluster 1, maltose/g3p/polyamine/iron) / ABC transporter, permease protein 2 (Cluster 1, maltose/g3p/polyamine/iron) n=1 Tax=hydrothermal vent metagenome TaxID=652676 RepID=A0A3B0SVW9_9ZZZZ